MQLFCLTLQYMSYRQAVDILEKLKALLQSNERSQNPLYKVPNVILTCCLIYEVASLVKREYSFLSGITEAIQERVERIGKAYIEGINDEDELRLLVFDVDF